MIVFIEIVKDLEKRIRKSKFSKGLMIVLIFAAITPIPLLISSIYNTYLSYSTYTGLLKGVDTYISLSSGNYLHIFQETNSLDNSIVIFGIKGKFNQNSSVVLNRSEFRINNQDFVALVYSYIQDLPLNVNKYIFKYLEQAIFAIVFVVFLYWFYRVNTEPA